MFKKDRTTDRWDMLVDETLHEEAFVIFLKWRTTEIENDLLFLTTKIYLVIFAMEFLMEIFDTPDIRGNLKRVTETFDRECR